MATRTKKDTPPIEEPIYQETAPRRGKKGPRDTNVMLKGRLTGSYLPAQLSSAIQLMNRVERQDALDNARDVVTALEPRGEALKRVLVGDIDDVSSAVSNMTIGELMRAKKMARHILADADRIMLEAADMMLERPVPVPPQVCPPHSDL